MGAHASAATLWLLTLALSHLGLDSVILRI